MKKTALTELIEFMDSRERAVPYSIREKATQLLEKEREQIEDAYYDGAIDSWTIEDTRKERASASKQYFNETYKK